VANFISSCINGHIVFGMLNSSFPNKTMPMLHHTKIQQCALDGFFVHPIGLGGYYSQTIFLFFVVSVNNTCFSLSYMISEALFLVA
jgi:hypothetical protein